MKKLTKRFLAVFTVVALLCSMALVANAETLSEENASVKTYTVQLGQATGVWYYFLHNATPTDGPVTLKYTVSEVKVALDDGNIGVVASTDGDATYPYEYGAYQNVVTASTLLSQGCTYTMVIDQNSDGTLSYTITYVDSVNDTSGSIELPNSVVKASGAQFFGLYGNCTTVATLTNVSCVDANGNDLGVALSANIGGEGKGGCSVTEEASESEPAQDLTPASDAAAKHYAVQLGDTNGVYYYLLRNAKATDGPVTLRYTVSAVDWRWMDPNGQHMGVVAAEDGSQDEASPESSSPYQFTRDTDSLMTVGRTYTMVIGRNADGTIAYSVTYTDAENTTPVAVDLPNAGAVATAANAQFFGLYSNRTVVATLRNVSCVDADGKDLGIALNSGMGGDAGANINNCSITEEEPEQPPVTLAPADDTDATRYSVQLGKEGTDGVYNYFLHNATATDGPVTLRYTVSALTWKWEDDNVGLAASTDGNGAYPQNAGLYQFENGHATSELLALGRTYTVVIARGEDGTLAYSVTYTDSEHTEPVTVELPHDNSESGNTGAGAKYFGLFSNRTVIASLTHVTCVDANGNDLGVALNSGMGGTGIGDCSVTAEDAPPATGDSFAAVLALAVLVVSAYAAVVTFKKARRF